MASVAGAAAASAGRVQVFCRSRPLLSREEGDLSAVALDPAQEQVVVSVTPDALSVLQHEQGKEVVLERKEKSFKLDGVFAEDSTQKEVFQRVGLPVLVEVMKGFNGCIFAYGQTGSGKTHSLLNTEVSDLEQVGILPRLVATLYARAAMDKQFVYKISCAGIQVYNEQVDDLLHPEHRKGKGSNLEIQSGGKMPELTWTECKGPGDLLELFKRARSCLHYVETKMNKASSRSHAVFQIRVLRRKRAENNNNNGGGAAVAGVQMQAVVGQLSVVDLAGSERVKKSGVTGSNFKEATNINGSLLALGNVIQALADKRKHVPFRDSKLTRILESSVGGNCKTSLLVCVSPSESSTSETLSTLEFASRAMCVEVNAVVNETVVELDASALAADMEEAAGHRHVDEEMIRTFKESEQALVDARLRAAEHEAVAASLQAKVGEMSGVLAERERTLGEALREARSTAGALEQLRGELQRAEQRHAGEAEVARRGAAQLQQQAAQAQAELQATRAELAVLSGQLTAQRTARDEAERRVEALQAELRAGQEQGQRAVAQLEAGKGELCAQLEAEARSREAERRDVAERLAQEQANAAQLASAVRVAEAERAELAGELARARERAEGLQQRLAEQGDRARALAAAGGAAADEAAALREQLLDAGAREHGLEARLAGTEARLADTGAAKGALELRLSALQALHERLSGELASESARRAELETLAAALGAELGQERQGAERARSEHAEAERRLLGELAASRTTATAEALAQGLAAAAALAAAEARMGEAADKAARHAAEALTALEERAHADQIKAADKLRAAEERAKAELKKLREAQEQELGEADAASRRALANQHEEAQARIDRLLADIDAAAAAAEAQERAAQEHEATLKEEHRLRLLRGRSAEIAARTAVEQGAAQLQNKYKQLHARFVARESRKEDLALIAQQQNDINELKKLVVNMRRLAKQKQLELDHVIDNVRIFGARGAETAEQAPGLPGQKVGDPRAFSQRRLATPSLGSRRAAKDGANPFGDEGKSAGAEPISRGRTETPTIPDSIGGRRPLPTPPAK